jgi:hypothetical protein
VATSLPPSAVFFIALRDHGQQSDLVAARFLLQHAVAEFGYYAIKYRTSDRRRDLRINDLVCIDSTTLEDVTGDQHIPPHAGLRTASQSTRAQVQSLL